MNSVRLVLLTTLLLAFSGCLSNDASEGDGNNAGVDSVDGGEEPAPVLTEHSCHVDAGAVVISFASDAGNVGGCQLVTLESTQTYHAEEVPSGCRVLVDLDGDDFSDEQAKLGKAYHSGHSIFSACDPGVVDVDVTITMAA